jgi:hypothetical protein
MSHAGDIVVAAGGVVVVVDVVVAEDPQLGVVLVVVVFLVRGIQCGRLVGFETQGGDVRMRAIVVGVKLSMVKSAVALVALVVELVAVSAATMMMMMRVVAVGGVALAFQATIAVAFKGAPAAVAIACLVEGGCPCGQGG